MPRVLVVDDEATARQALRRALENDGMTVLEAHSGGAALQLLATDAQVDAVVCDVLMPEMNGVDLYDRLIVRAPGLARRVVFVSSATHDPRVHLPVEARGLPLVSKLDDLMLVVDAIRVALIESR
jgi:CheY-like chemotaxis protein